MSFISMSFLQNLIQQTTMSQPSYSSFVTPIMHAEFDMASEYDTKKTICERAAKKITAQVHEILQVPVVPYCSPTVVHPEIAKMIETYYKSLISKPDKMDDLKMRFAVFKSSDVLEPHIIKNLIREFIKCTKDDNNTLNVILAADGMAGARLHDLTNYIQNLVSVSDLHLAAVREMYDKVGVVGTDAVFMIRKCLLEIYGTCNRNSDYEVMITKELEIVDKYFKEKDINVSNVVEQCKEVYLAKVGDNLERFAMERLNVFWNYLKRKSESKKRKLEDTNKENEEVKDGKVKGDGKEDGKAKEGGSKEDGKVKEGGSKEKEGVKKIKAYKYFNKKSKK